MGRPAVEPDHDAIDVLRRRARGESRSRLRAQAQQVAEADPNGTPDAELNEVTAGDAGAVAVQRHIRRGFQGARRLLS